MIYINKIGVVKKVDKDSLDVWVMRSSACGGNCKTCGGCEVESLEIKTGNDIDAKLGDRVELVYETSTMLKATAILYLIPLVALILGVVLGYVLKLGETSQANDLISFVIGLVFMAISLLIVHQIDKKYKTEELIKVKKI